MPGAGSQPADFGVITEAVGRVVDLVEDQAHARDGFVEEPGLGDANPGAGAPHRPLVSGAHHEPLEVASEEDEEPDDIPESEELVAPSGKLEESLEESLEDVVSEPSDVLVDVVVVDVVGVSASAAIWPPVTPASASEAARTPEATARRHRATRRT